MRRLALIASLILFVGLNAMFAQTTTITGAITDSETGEPMPGVSVVVRGTTIGTVTNVDGNYSLSVPDDATNLLYSFVGMKTQDILIEGRTTINVVMESEAIGVDEVVVTALGVSREKKSLGYASQNVKSDELTSANSADAMSALSGKVAGVQISGSNFAGSKNVLIRGASSLTGNNQPLYVIDGVPMDNQNFNSTSTQTGGGGVDYGSMINDINPNDIESVNVLKGSAASALYGSRGQNGVIMITTKSGKAGKKSFSVDVNTGVTFEKVYILPELQTSYGGGYGDFGTEVIDGVEYLVPAYDVDESWGPKYEGQQVLHWWGIADYEQGITSTPQTGAWVAPKNDVEDFFETGVQYQNSISITTSNETSALRIGYTNVNTSGTVPNASQNKNTFNLNGNTKLFDGIVEANATMTYVNTYTKGRPVSGYDDRSFSQKFYQWGQRQLDFEKLKDYKNPDGTQRVWNRISIDNPNPIYSDNPYWTVYENYQDDDRQRVYGTTGLKFNLTDDLNVQGNVYLDTYTFNQRERVAPGSQSLSFYDVTQRQFTEVNYEGKINYKKTVNDFNIVASLGANKRTEDYSRIYSGTDGGLAVAGLWNVNNSNNTPLTENYSRKKIVNSWFAFASLGWKNTVYLDLTARQDHDTSLPTDDNTYFYPAASLSFIISEMVDFTWLDMAKVRMNYAETGNGTDPYRVYQSFNVGDSFGGYRQFTNNTRLNNAKLKSEKTKEVEFGLEASALNNRVRLDVSYYKRNTTDQIVPIELSGSTGFTSMVVNAGEIENKGIELLVGGTPIRTADWTWDISVNYAKNKNEVVSLPEGFDKLQIGSAPFGGAYLNASVGDPFQMLWGYDYVYDDKGNKVIDEGSGFYANGGLKPIGSALPDYNMGIRNSLRWKDIDFSALIDIQKGGKYYSLTNMWGMYSGMMKQTATPTSGGNTIREDGIVLNGVIDNGDGTYRENDINISAVDYGEYHYHGYGTPSATSFFDASYIKLREITIGYTLPSITPVIKKMRIGVYGRNLATWGLDNKGIDPEATVGGSGNIQGMEGGIIPTSRSYGMNLQVTF